MWNSNSSHADAPPRKVRLRIVPKARLDNPGESQVEKIVSVQMRELATINGPCWIAMRPKPRRGFFHIGQAGQFDTQSLNRAHVEVDVVDLNGILIMDAHRARSAG